MSLSTDISFSMEQKGFSVARVLNAVFGMVLFSIALYCFSFIPDDSTELGQGEGLLVGIGFLILFLSILPLLSVLMLTSKQSNLTIWIITSVNAVLTIFVVDAFMLTSNIMFFLIDLFR